MKELFRLGEALFPFFLDFLCQATVLMLVVFVASRVMGKARAQARYWLWVYCLLGVLLLPLTSFVLNDHRIPLLPGREARGVHDIASGFLGPSANTIKPLASSEPADSVVRPDAAPIRTASPTPQREGELTTQSHVGDTAALDHDSREKTPEGVTHRIASGETASPSSPEYAVSVAAAQDSMGDGETGSVSVFPWRAVLSIAWVAGCAIFFVRLLFAAVCVARVWRSSSDVSDPALSGLFEKAKKAAGVRSRVRLRLCNRPASPVSVGVFRPTIFLPESLARELSPEQLYPILLHELAHVRSGDCAVNLLERIVKSLLFFHPLVWAISRQVHVLREEICDDRVLDHYPDGVLYARVLTEVAGRNVPSRLSPLATLCFFNHRALIERRVERILGAAKCRRRRFRLGAAVTLLSTTFAMVAALSLASLSARAVEEKASPSDAPSDVTPPTDSSPSGQLPEGTLLDAVYNHCSRGGDYGTSTLQIKRDKDGAITAIAELRGTTYEASGDKEHHLTEYKLTSREREGFEWLLTFEEGKVISKRKTAAEEGEVSEIPVTKDSLYDPNSRPDPYCVANILLRQFALKEGNVKEVNAYDWDNAGKGMATYTFKIEHKGKEEVRVPAGTFQGNHIVLTQLTTGDTWYKKRAGHVTDFWVLDDYTIVRILRHREPYELLLAEYKSASPLRGLKERARTAITPDSYVTMPIRSFPFAGRVYAVAFSSDGNEIAAGNAAGEVRLWNTATGEEIRTFSGDTDRVASIAFSPDGKQILSGSWDGTARLRHAATGDEIRTFEHAGGVEQVMFSPDGAKVLTACHDGTARLWDASTGEEIRGFCGHAEDLSWAAFSPDGTKVVTSSMDGTAKLWDAETAEELLTFTRHASRVHSAAFSPDGKSVLTSDDDGLVKLWDAATGKEMRTLYGHRWPVWCVAFSPDGSKIATGGSYEGTARVWDAATGAGVRTFVGHRGPVDQVAFSPDGRYVATACFDGSVRLWDVGGIPAKEAAAVPAIEVQREAEVFIDLEPYFNAGMKAFSAKPGNDLTIPAGEQHLAGLDFRVRKGIIWIGGSREENKGMPLKVEGIKIGLKLTKLHFLHATCWTAPEGAQIGSYIIHYEDGATAVIPLAYGVNIRNWWIHGEPRGDISEGTVAWQGVNPYAWSLTRLRVQLYSAAWENPQPDKVVDTMDFVSSNTECAPYLVALTAETGVAPEPGPERKPVAAGPEKPVGTPSEVIINAAEDGTLIVSKTEMSIQELEDLLQRTAKEYPGLRVIVRCHPKTPHETIIRVLGACEKAGISNVSFSVSEQEEKGNAAETPPPAEEKEVAEPPTAQTTASPEALYVEGSNLRSQGRTEEALKVWRTLIEQFPESDRAGCAAVYMGQLQLSTKDYKGAEESFRLAAEKFGHQKYGNGVEVGGYGYFCLTQVYCDTEQYEKAAEALKSLVEKYPYSTGHRMGDALTSFRAKRWFYDKLKAQRIDLKFLDNLIAEQKDPKNFDKMNSRQLYLVAHTLMREDKDNATAIKAFLKGVEKFPEESFTPYGAVFAMQLQLDEKDHAGAKQTARLMIEKYPTVEVGKGGPVAAIGYYGLGAAHFLAEEYKNAAEMFQKVAEQFPAAADMDGVPLKSHIRERYLDALKEKGIEVKGFED
jgi:beta-lactamase regulating signal transducer with metallopeptidase domain/TolA-binding protein